MNIQISNRHASANGDIKQFVESELKALESKYSIIGADVILDHEGRGNVQYSAEINVKVKGSTIHAKESSEEIGKSIDLAVKTLEKRLKKHKDTHYASIEIKRTGREIR